MGRGIQLTRSEVKNVNHWYLRAVRLKIEVTAVNGGMDRYVFVYRKRPANPTTGEIINEFMSVTSPVDLVEYPVGQPDPDKPFPFFRNDVIEVDIRSATRADEFWSLIHAEVCRLVTVLNLMDDLVVAESVWCGDQPEPDISESESESASMSESESESVSVA